MKFKAKTKLDGSIEETKINVESNTKVRITTQNY